MPGQYYTIANAPDWMRELLPDLFPAGSSAPVAPPTVSPPAVLDTPLDPGFLSDTPGLGLPPTNYEAPYGGIPTVPNPVDTAGGAVAGNLSNMPDIMAMLRSYNPNYDAQQGIIGHELAGQLPPDVIAQIAQRGAERGVAMGSPMSPNSSAAMLAAMGLTSLDQVNRGMSNASGLADQSYRFMSPMMVSPEQQQANSLLQSIFNAAPIPGAAARAAEEAMNRAFERYRNLMQTVPGQGAQRGLSLGGSAPAYPTLPRAVTPFSGDRYANPPPVYGPGGGPNVFGDPAYTGGFRWNPSTGQMERTGDQAYGGSGSTWSPDVWDIFDEGFNYGGTEPPYYLAAPGGSGPSPYYLGVPSSGGYGMDTFNESFGIPQDGGVWDDSWGGGGFYEEPYNDAPYYIASPESGDYGLSMEDEMWNWISDPGNYDDYWEPGSYDTEYFDWGG